MLGFRGYGLGEGVLTKEIEILEKREDGVRTTAMVLGIIWGLLLMGYAFYVYLFGKVSTEIGADDKSLMMVGAVLTPILAFVGAGMAKGKPVIAAALLIGCGVIIFATLGINSAGAFFGGPMLIAGALAFFGANELKAEAGK